MAITKRTSRRSTRSNAQGNRPAHRLRHLRPQPRAIAFAVGTALLPWTFLDPVLAQTAASTLPAGGQVTAGSATLTYSPNKLQIDQSTGKAIINWDSFSIGSSAWVNFSQPSASAVALNRVVGSNPSEIYGRLTANGSVFFTNPNGVLFARGASVEVGSLFATTLSIADQDFLAGRYNFYNAGGAGSVVNQGNIVTANGYAALAGPQVRNDGIIVAHAGTVALAAGDRVSLDMIGDGLIKVSVDQAAMNASAINAGTIQADGGNVILTARSANALLDTVVNNSGVIRANSLAERNGEIVLDGGTAGVVSNTGTLSAAGIEAGTTGGTVKVLGQYVGLFDGTAIDASGDAGGGTVLVGGDFHGAGAEQNASRTYVASNVSINADGITSGNGGQVAVWSNDQTNFYGSVSARGGAQGGNGGFVEVSGKQNLDYRGYVDARAPAGTTGTLLLDPTEITIDHGANQAALQLVTDGITVTGAGPFTDTATVPVTGGTLTDGTINTQLVTANVTVTTSSGDIVISNAAGPVAIGPAVANASTLTLNSAANISWNAAWSYANSGQLSVYAAGGAISGTGALTVGGSSPVLMQASSGIGTSLSPILTSGLSQLAAGTATGGIFVSNGGSGNVTIASLTNPVTATAVNGLNVATSGDISLVNSAGNINVNQAISTPSVAATAVVLSAGDGTAAGTATGGDVTVGVSGSISTGVGGRAELFTGSVSGSTGVTTLVGSGSGNFRYGSTPTLANYTLALSLTGTNAIYRETPTLTITADNKGPVTYASAIPAYTTSVTGLQNGDTAVQALSTAATVTDDNVKSTSGNLTAGSHALTPAGAVGQLGYTLTYATGTLSISPLTLAVASIAASSSTYGSPLAPGAVTLNAGVVGTDVVSSSATVNTSTLSTSLHPIVGSYTQTASTLSGTDAGNYTLTPFTSAANYTINPLALTVASIAASSSTYGSPLAPGAVTLNAGVLGTDVVSGSATVNTSTLSTSLHPIVGSYTQTASTLSGTDAGNYTLTPFTSAANYTISQRPVATAIAAASSTYGSALTPGAATSDVVLGDLVTTSVAVNTAGTSTSGNPVTGTYTQTASASAGADAANYATFTSAANYTINPLALTVASIAASSSTYGSPLAPGAVTLNAGVVGTDVVSSSATVNTSTLSTSGNPIVGTYTHTASTLSGADAANYTLTPFTTLTQNYTINPAALTISGITASNKVYDGNTGATINTGGAVYTGLVTGDVVTVNATGTFSDKDVGSGKTVTLVSGYTGADTANYSIASQPTTTANITQLASVAWTGAGGNSLWSNATNWAGNAIPDKANVASVNLSGATVTFDNTVPTLAGSVQISNVSNGSLAVNSSTLAVASNLNVAGYTQTGGAVSTGGSFTVTNSFSQTAGTITSTGAVSITQATGALTAFDIAGSNTVLLTANNSTGDITLASGGSVSGATAMLTAGRNVSLNSPLSATTVSIGFGQQVAGTFTPTSAITGATTVTGGVSGDLFDFSSAPSIAATLAGGGGSDTLKQSGGKVWNLNNAIQNSGTSGTLTWSAIGNLTDTGAATFNMGTGGTVSGSISAIGGSVTYASYATPVTFNLNGGASTGVATWTGVTSVTGSAATTDTITGTGTYTITGSNTGNNGTVFWTSFENLNGGGGSTLQATSATWNLSGSNTGTVTNLSGTFSGMANLIDLGTATVNMGSSGSITGSLNGGTNGSMTYASYGSGVAFSLSGAAASTTGIGGTRTGITSVTGSANSDTITGSSATYNLTGSNSGNASGISWTSFENIADATAGTFNLTVASNNVTGTLSSGGSATLGSSLDIGALNTSIPGTLTMSGTANTWTLTGATQPSLFQTTNPNANVYFNGTCVGGPACGTVIVIVGTIGSTVAQIAAQALKDAQSTDSVAKIIDYGFAGDVGTTPPMDHRIDVDGISTPQCFEESRESAACKNN